MRFERVALLNPGRVRYKRVQLGYRELLKQYNALRVRT
jgi:hypothetical protein